MTEAEFIKKIQELKQIKPRKDWVVLIKREIFRQPPTTFREPFFASIFSPRKWWGVPWLFRHYKPALATFVFLGIMTIAVFGFAQNALPGDFLYTFKKASEKGQAVFVLETDKPKTQLELANRRLEELVEIAATNQTSKLASAINEVQASAIQAAKNLRAPKKITKEIVEQTRKIEENKQKVEALGILIGETKELDNALAQLVEREIKDLESRTLSEEEAELLEQAKSALEEGNFSTALEKILFLSQL